MEKPTTLDSYRLMGRSGLRVSPLCMGGMNFGTSWGFGVGSEEGRKIFDVYYQKGGNFIDTANLYTNGESEKITGEYISGKRSHFVVATKYSLNPNLTFNVGPSPSDVSGSVPNPSVSGNSRKSLAENLDQSLKRLGIGYIDLLYLHAWEYRTPIEEVMRIMDDVVRSGKVLYCGISDTPSWVISRGQTIAELRGWSPFVCLQSRYNLLDRSFEDDLGPMCRELGIGTAPWGPLAEGFLTGKHQKESLGTADTKRSTSINNHGKLERNWEILEVVKQISKEINRSPSQVSLNWMLRKGATSPIVGARTLEQMEENLSSLEFVLTDEQMERLEKVSKPVSKPFPHEFLKTQAFTYLNGNTKVEHPPQYKSLF